MKKRLNIGRLLLLAVTAALLSCALSASGEISERLRERIRERSRADTQRVETKSVQPTSPRSVSGVLGSPRVPSGPPAESRSVSVFSAPRPSRSPGSVLGGNSLPQVSSPQIVTGGSSGGRQPVSPGPVVIMGRPETRQPVAPGPIAPGRQEVRVSPPSVGMVLGSEPTRQVAPRAPTQGEGSVSASTSVSGVLGAVRDRVRQETSATTQPVQPGRGEVHRGASRSAPSPSAVLGGASRPNAVTRDTGRPVRIDDAYSRGAVDTSVGQTLGAPAGQSISTVLGESRVTKRIYSYGPGRRTTRSGRVVVIPPYSYRSTTIFLGFGDLYPRYRIPIAGYSVNYFYYPYYCEAPIVTGYTVFPSLYFYYGTVPRYVYGPRIIVLERPTYIIEREVRVLEDDVDYYYLSPEVRTSLKETLQDIKEAWEYGDFDLLLRHVRAEGKIHVYIRGKYSYSLTTEDYRDMTKDAIEHTDTKSFEWVKTENVSDSEVVAKAKHVFLDKDGNRRTVYASYRLVKERGVWWIVGVGTSNKLSDD